MGKPTWPVSSDQQPVQSERVSIQNSGFDSDDDYNQQILGRPLGFIPLYMLPSTLRQKMRHQQLHNDGLERKMQPLGKGSERLSNLDQENTNIDPEQQRLGKNLIDPSSIHLPGGHPPVTVDQLLTGSSNPSQSDHSPVINPPDLNNENLDTIDSQKQSTQIDPSSIKLPAGHPPVPLNEVIPNESLQKNPSQLEGDPSLTKEPFEFPAEHHSDMTVPQERERSLNQHQVSPLDEPHAMPRQKRQCDHHIEHHYDSFNQPYDRPFDHVYERETGGYPEPHDRPYDHIFDGETGAYPEDYLGQRPRDDWDDVYDAAEVVDVYHHVL